MHTSGIQAEIAKKSIRNNEDVENPKSKQEEADSRLILHCIYATRILTRKISVLSSPGKDGFVFLMHHWSAIKAKEIYFMTGIQSKHTNLKMGGTTTG